MSDRTIRIELRVDGKGRVQGDFVQIGKAGEDALRKIKEGSGHASSGLLGLDAVSRKLSGTLGALIGGNFTRLATTFSTGFGVSKAIGLFADFEQGLIGVGKTTDISGAQLKALGEEIESLSRRVPVGTGQLLEIAQAAGQLGVKGEENIVRFTETVAKLGLASNLAGEEAATSLARILTVTGTSVSQVDKLGSVIVRLGNNFAATESEIADVATRVAQSTALFDVAVEDVAGIATALRAAGVEAEAGGTVVGRAFQAINDAIRGGGDELKALVRITGVSAQEIARIFRDEPVEAFQLFVDGLGRISREGGDVASAMEGMGLEGVRVIQVMGTLAARSELLRAALEMANDEMQRNTALNTEAGKASESLLSQWQLFKNEVSALGTELGETLAPALRGVIGYFRELLSQGNDAVDHLKRQRDVLDDIARDRLLQSHGIESYDDLLREIATKRVQLIQAERIAAEIGNQAGVEKLQSELKLLEDTLHHILRITEETRNVAAEIQELDLSGIPKKIATGGEAPEKTKKELQDRARALEAIIRLEQEAARAGLEGVDLLAVRRDQEIAAHKERLEQGLITEEEFNRARLAAEEIFQKEKAEIEADAAEKAAERRKREMEREAKERERENEERRREAEREAQRQAEAFARPFIRAAENIQDGFSDALFNIFRGSKNRDLVGDFLDFVKDGFARLLAELATLALVRPIIVPVVAGAANMLMGGQASSQLLQALGGGGGGSLLSNLWTTGQVFQHMGTGIPGFGGGIFSTGGGLTGMINRFGVRFGIGQMGSPLSHVTLSELGTAAVLGGIGGSMLADLVGLNSRNGGIGGSIGATIGMAATPILGPLGPVIGGVAGSLLGGLFGDKDYPFARAQIVVRDGVASVGDVHSLDKGDSAAARTMAQAVVDQFNAMVQQGGLVLSKQNFSFTVGSASGRPGSRLGKGFFAGEHGSFARGATFTGLQTPEEAIQKALEYALDRAAPIDQALVQMAAAIKGSGSESVAAQIKAITDQFDALRKNAKALDLTKAEINKAEREALDQLAYQLTGGLIDAAKAFRLSLKAMEKQFDDLRKNADALGLSVKELDAAQKRTLNGMLWQQRTQLGNLAGRARQLLGIDSLEAFRSELQVGPLSSLSLSDQFSAQAALVRRTAAAALAGDPTAAQNFAGIAQSALQLNNQVNASGPAGAAFFSEVNRLLNQVLEQQRRTAESVLGGDPATLIREGIQDQIRATREESKQTREVLQQIKRELKRLNAKAA